jgi:hypothetical protein
MWTRLAHSRATRRFPIWAFLLTVKRDTQKELWAFLLTVKRDTQIWATLLTVKRDTGGANNQISEKLRELKR